MANLLFPLNARRVKWSSQVEDDWDVAERTAQEYTLDRGAIVFNHPPNTGAVVMATYDYWWKVVFAKKRITVKQKFVNLFECSIALKVVR